MSAATAAERHHEDVARLKGFDVYTNAVTGIVGIQSVYALGGGGGEEKFERACLTKFANLSMFTFYLTAVIYSLCMGRNAR